MSDPLFEADDLTIQYQTDNGNLTAVSDASFAIREGEYFGLVGESGCGKSTVAKAIIGGMDDNAVIASGEMRYRGEPIQSMSDREFNEKVRWSEISFIPQSSMNSLDPLERVSDQALEIADVHTDLSKSEALSKFEEMFEVVGLPESRIDDYPHEFSGGMQQRAIIALALFLEPSLIVADEPTTALDVIMQDMIFKYLDKIREETGASMLLITHDISVVFESCDRMAVMHSGQIAEEGSVEAVYDVPHHPYALLLQRAFPDHRHRDRELEVIEGTPPQSFGEIHSCTFADRCPWATSECRTEAPTLESVGDRHSAACFHTDDVREDVARGTDLDEVRAERQAQGGQGR